MPQSEAVDVLDEDSDMSDQNAAWIANQASRALQDAAYWRGRCDGQDQTIAYLKDRLNRAELGVPSSPPKPSA